MYKNIMGLLGGILAGVIFLSGCVSFIEEDKNQIEVSAPTPGNIAVSPLVESTSTSALAPTRPDLAGGAYTSEEQALISTGTFIETENALTAWAKYWTNATNNPFNPQTTSLHFKYVFDGTRKSAGVCLETKAHHDVCFALPIVNGVAIEIPPAVSGVYSIPEELEPLKLSTHLMADQVTSLGLDETLVDSILGWENGIWVRNKDGKLVAALDMMTAKWMIAGNWEVFANTIYSVYKGVNGKVEMAKVNDTKYAAEMIEVDGLPPILICIDKDKVKNTFSNGRVELNTDLYPDAAERMENSYLGALAVAYYRGQGMTNPSVDEITVKVAEFKEILKNGRQLGGIKFYNYRGESFALTGQPLVVILDEFTTNNPGWDMVVGMFTYRIDVSPNLVAIRIYQTDSNLEKDYNALNDNGIHSIGGTQVNGLSPTAIRQMGGQVNFLNSYVKVLRFLGGSTWNDITTLNILEQLKIPSVIYLSQQVDPNYIYWVKTDINGLVPALNSAITNNDAALIKKIFDDQNDPESYYSVFSKYIGTSILKVVDIDASILE